LCIRDDYRLPTGVRATNALLLSSHLRGTVERMCDIALRLAQVFVLCQNNGKLLRAFENLNKRNKAFSFRSFREKLHGIVFARLFQDGYALRKGTVFLSLVRRINASFLRVLSLANKGLEKHSDCTMIPKPSKSNMQYKVSHKIIGYSFHKRSYS